MKTKLAIILTTSVVILWLLLLTFLPLIPQQLVAWLLGWS